MIELLFLESNELGLMAFSSGALSDGQLFEEILTVGEIKSGTDRKKSYRTVSQEALYHGVCKPRYIWRVARIGLAGRNIHPALLVGSRG